MYPFLKPGDRLVIRKILPHNIQIGDILAVHTGRQLSVHRVVKTLPDQQFITKGDSILSPDHLPVQAGAMVGKVAIILRGRRLIPVATGYRERFKPLYAWLSIRNITWGALKVNIKQGLYRRPTEKENGFHVDDRQKSQQWLSDQIFEKQNAYPEIYTDIDSLERAAVGEGLAGYLYPKVKLCGAPEKAIAVFKKHYLNNAARNLIGQSSIARLESDLQEARMRVIILKGASLPETIYPRPGLRMMEDIDILVRLEDQKKFITLLGRHGYQVDPGRGHCFIKGNTIVDLHTDALNVDRIDSRKWLFPAGMQPVWDQAIPWKEGSRQILRPSDVDNVMLLSQHALKHACGRLIWLVDIWLLLKDRPSQFWKDLYDRAMRLGQVRALYQILFLLELEFNLEIPPPFKSPAGKISWLNRQLLIFREDGHTDAFAGILLPLLSISGFKRRLRFGWESVFLNRTTAEKEFGEVFTSRPVFYYLNRIGFSVGQVFNFLQRMGRAICHQWGV